MEKHIEKEASECSVENSSKEERLADHVVSIEAENIS